MHPIDQIKKITRITPDVEISLRSVMRKGTFRKGTVISGAANLTSYAYYIVKGSARVFITVNGKEHTFSFFFDDEFALPAQEALRLNPDTISIQFLEDTTVIYVPPQKVRDLIVENTETSDAKNIPALVFLNVALVRYTSMLEQRIIAMQTMSAPERYKWLIEKYPRLLEVATVTQIASYLGLTKETLYRIRNSKY